MTQNHDGERPFDLEAHEREVRERDVAAASDAQAFRDDDVALDADGAGMLLYAERLVPGVERVEAGRVEVRKRIVVEEVTVTVPVRREVVDVVRVYDDGSEEALEVPASTWTPRVVDEHGTSIGGPVDESSGRAQDVYDVEADHETHSQAPAGAPGEARSYGALDEGSGVVILREERPVISTAVYATERLRLDVGTVSDTVTITESVRREVAELEGSSGAEATQGPDAQRAGTG